MNKIDEIAFTTNQLRNSRMFNKLHKFIVSDGSTRQIIISHSAGLAVTQFICFTDEGKFTRMYVECQDLGEVEEEV